MRMLKPAQNRMAYAKIGLYGNAGSGKTYTAAQMAIGLHQFAGCKKPVGMFDTEPAASYIIPLFRKAGIEFLVYDESRALADLMRFMDEAEQECSVVIVDSITHIWRDAQESYLAKINAALKRKGKNPIFRLEFHHWMPIKAEWAKFTDRFLSSKMHMIVCGRAGSVYEYQTNEQTGKKELITTGTKMATEKELGYEPSLLIEMIGAREDGKIVNRALVQKDRTDTVNGAEIDRPSFDSFRSHFEFLNIGGQHFDSMDARDSQELFTEEGSDRAAWYAQQKDIALDEIKEVLNKHHGGTSAAAKDAKRALIEEHAGTPSWAKVESLSLEQIQEIRGRLWIALEGKPYEYTRPDPQEAGTEAA